MRLRHTIQLARVSKYWHAYLAVTTFFASVVCVYLIVAAAAFFAQRRLMYPAPHDVGMPKSSRGKLLTIEGQGHRRIHAFYVPARDRQSTVVILHGNAELLADQVELAEDFAESGLGSFAIEYPGYGLSADSRTTESNVYADVETALLHLQGELNVARESMVLYGRSLGTGIATEMALRGYGSRLVLVSAYTSMVALAERTVPFLPTRWLVLDRYDTLGKAPRITQPALVVHGAMDSIVPLEMAKRVANSLATAQLEVVPNAEHNDLLYVGGPALWRRITNFSAKGQP